MEPQTAHPRHVETLNVVETLLEMNLYLHRVLGLAEDLEQVVVGDEVEAWEDLSLGLEVHVERLLNVFQPQVHCGQLVQQTCMQQW